MILAHHKWSHINPGDVEVDYPDELIQPFVQFLVRNKHWMDNPTLIKKKLAKFKMDLYQYRLTVEQQERHREMLQAQMDSAMDVLIPPFIEYVGALVREDAETPEAVSA